MAAAAKRTTAARRARAYHAKLTQHVQPLAVGVLHDAAGGRPEAIVREGKVPAPVPLIAS